MQRILVLGALLLLAACGSAGTAATSGPTTTSSNSPVPPAAQASADPLIVIVTSGGCFMGGPNCASYLVWPDGTFEVHRTSTDTPVDHAALLDALVAGTPELVGNLPAELTGRLSAVIAGTDLAALRAGLGPGSCQGCVDGIDTVLGVPTADGLEVFSSLAVGFDPELPLFSTVQDAQTEMSTREPLPIIQGW